MKQSLLEKISRYFLLPLLVIIMGFLLIRSVKNDSATADEAIHILSGYLSLKDKDFRLDPEHPFLGRQISALPLLILQPDIDYRHKVFKVVKDYFYDSWFETRDAAQKFLYSWGNSADQILFYSRLPIIIATLLFALVFYLITKKIFGWSAAIISLTLFVFSPNVLGHARLANTDLWFCLAYFLTIFSYAWYLKISNKRLVTIVVEHSSLRGRASNKLIDQKWFRLLIAGLSFGFALSIKFSALILPIVMLAIWIAYYFFKKKKKCFLYCLCRAFLDFILICLIGFLIVWASYGFSIESFDHYVGIQIGFIVGNYNDTLIKLQPLIYYLQPAQYFKGIILTLASAFGERPAYLLGQFSYGGWWYYFPVAFLIKTPILTILLLIVSTIFFIVKKIKLKFCYWVVILSTVVFFIITLFSKLNLGIRHLLPIYPFIFIWIGIFFSELIKKYLLQYRYIIILIIIILIGFYIYSSMSIYPSYLAYFNEAVGGAENGGQYLTDSNIDWGQDLKRLKKYLDDNQITEPIKLEYFWTGLEGPTYYGINWQRLEANDSYQTGYIAIGVSALQTSEFNWLKNYQPIARIGWSVYLYKIE